MTIPLIDLNEQYTFLRPDLEEALARVLSSQKFILGPEVEALEAEMSTYLGVRHAIGVASGTDALLLPLKALEAEPGSDVIVPSFTFFATAGAVWNAGLRPVFCDVHPQTFNVTREAIERVWTDRTVAVVAVHLFGQMADMTSIRQLTQERRAFLLEDAAQAIGARRGSCRAGSAGDAAAFSFFPTKNLGCFGDGGMVTTNDDSIADKVRKLRVHGGVKMYHHEMVGTNSRLDALQAAILRAKLPHLDGWTAARRRNALRYMELLSGVPEVGLPVVQNGSYHVYNQFTLQTERRDELRQHLSDAGIGSGIYYPVPLHLQQCFSALGSQPGDLPVSERLCDRVLSLPVYPELRDEDVRTVAEAVRTFFQDSPGTE